MLEKSTWYKYIIASDEYKTITKAFPHFNLFSLLSFHYHAGSDYKEVKQLFRNFIERKI